VQVKETLFNGIFLGHTRLPVSRYVMDTLEQQYTAQGPDMETRLLGVGPADETVHSTWPHHF